MMNLLLYLVTVLIWGASWIGISYQIAEVEPVHAVLYRYALAAVLTFLLLAALGRLKPMPARAHVVCLVMGVVLFGVNYVMVYEAVALGLSSGLAAVVFSLLLVMNALNARVFHGERPGPGFALAAGLGLGGIACLFVEDVMALAGGAAPPLALIICVIAVYGASIGNMLSRRFAPLGVDVLTANGWAMAYAALTLLPYAALFERPFTFSTGTGYLVSLVLLTVFATIVAFWTYFTLVARIGAARAAYSFVAFPAVALVISSIWEGFVWTPAHVVGIVLILIGNLTLLRGAQASSRAAS